MDQDLVTILAMGVLAGAALAVLTAAVTWRVVLAAVLLTLALAIAFGAVTIGT